MCGPLSGISGGDLHSLRLVREWNNREPGSALLLAPRSVHAAALVGDDDFLPVRTPLDRWLRGLVSYALVIALRTLVATVIAPRARFAIAASHFVQDVIPVVLHRIRYGSQPVAYIYHLVSDMERTPGLRTRLSTTAEQMSLALLRFSDALVFVDNEETLRSLKRRGLNPRRLVPTRNAYDPIEPVPSRSQPETPQVVFVGRFTEEKGVWDMLDLARALREHVPAARIEMFGAGPLQREFAEQVAQIGLTNVDAPGFVDEETKWRALRAATVFVAPSREEGWGIAVGEALMAEVPVVIYDLSAYSHLGDLPIRIPVGDVSGFVNAVIGLLTDKDRLAYEQERVSRAAETLPKWREVLGSELAALEGDANPAAPLR
jgi:glycosyltransferase involved in cell wall biosynthesis